MRPAMRPAPQPTGMRPPLATVVRPLGGHNFTRSTQLLLGLATCNAPLSVGQCRMWFVTICTHFIDISKH